MQDGRPYVDEALRGFVRPASYGKHACSDPALPKLARPSGNARHGATGSNA